MDRIFNVVELFEMDEALDVVFFCKSFAHFIAMLTNAPYEVVCHANIQCAADSTGKNVDVKVSFSTQAGLDASADDDVKP